MSLALDDGEVTDLLEYTISNRAVVARKLESFIVPFGNSGIPEAILEACKTQDLDIDILGF